MFILPLAVTLAKGMIESEYDSGPGTCRRRYQAQNSQATKAERAATAMPCNTKATSILRCDAFFSFREIEGRVTSW